jgi:hypothetical protein
MHHFAPQNSKARDSLGSIVGGLDPIFNQEDPQMCHFGLYQADKPTRLIPGLSETGKSNDAREQTIVLKMDPPNRYDDPGIMLEDSVLYKCHAKG